MPKLRELSQKQQTFGDCIVAGVIGVDAARMAGYEGNYMTLANVSAENLKKPKIKDYIEAKKAEIRAKNEAEAIFTRQESLAELTEAQLMAKAQKRPDRMVMATKAKNKLFGLEIDKIGFEDDPGHRPPNIEEARALSESKRRAIASKVLGENNE